MNNPTVKLEDMIGTVRSVAWGAMKILRSYYRGEANSGNLEINEAKKDGPVTAADIAANQYILEKLQEAFGTEIYGYLSEETHQGNEPLPQDWVWIIDPLDGTRDFIDKTGEYALHIALAYQQSPVLSLVGIPESQKLYFAVKGQGTFVETMDGKLEPIKVSSQVNADQLTLVVSRTHRDQRFQTLIDRLSFSARHYVGSVGCKIVAVLEKRADIYISLSGKSAAKDWDFAAPELILTEAGGEFTYFNGDRVLYNRGDVSQWGGIFASNGSFHQQLCQQSLEILADIDQP